MPKPDFSPLWMARQTWRIFAPLLLAAGAGIARRWPEASLGVLIAFCAMVSLIEVVWFELRAREWKQWARQATPSELAEDRLADEIARTGKLPAEDERP